MSRYFLEKTLEISACHHLDLPYKSKCQKIHGHNWIITVFCSVTQEEVDSNSGMVVDFTQIKEEIHGVLDHQNLNDVLPFNPTAENIAKWVCQQIRYCYRVDVQESAGNKVSYVV